MTLSLLRLAHLALVFFIATSAHAKELTPTSFARVIEVIDGDTVVLHDGREVRLVGTQAPKLPLGRRNFAKWPLADEAKRALVKLTLGQDVALAYGGRRRDRHGRELAHLYLQDGRWVQGQMLSGGMARVYTFADNRALVSELLARERRARRARKGIWAHPYYAVRGANGLDDHVGSFQLVEGKVRSAQVRGKRAYLNFGRNWRSDFTVSLDDEALWLFKEAGINPEHYEGRRIRVRGWLRSYNGPLIEASHPEQIEVID